MSDVKLEEVDPDPIDGAKTKKTAAVSAIQTITQKYEQGKGSQAPQTSVLSTATSEGDDRVTDTASATDATSNAYNEQSNSQKAPSMTDEQADMHNEDSSRPSRSQKSGRKKIKGTSAKTSKTRKRKTNPQKSSEGEQISFLSVMNESGSFDVNDSHASEECHPVSDAKESEEIVHIPTADLDAEEHLSETSEPASNDADEGADESADLDDPMHATGGIFVDGPMDEDVGSDDDAEVYGDLASLGVIDEEGDGDNIDIATLNEPTREFDSTEISEDQATTSDGVEVISRDDIEIVPTKKYRRNLYGDTLMKRRNNDTPQKIDFVIES